MDKHVTRTGDDYAEALLNELPDGRAWPRQVERVVSIVCTGLAQVWGALETAASKLLEVESDPRITQDLLPDWERNFGLPDECYSEPLTIGDRQIALVQRMTLEGAQSREFFITEAAKIGYVISITEYRPFVCGLDRCGDNRVIGDGSGTQRNYLGKIALNTLGLPLALNEHSEYPAQIGADTIRYMWTVHVAAARLTWFRVGGGGGQVGVDPHLRIAIASDLECIINRWKPAHTLVLYDYSGLSEGGSMAGTP